MGELNIGDVVKIKESKGYTRSHTNKTGVIKSIDKMGSYIEITIYGVKITGCTNKLGKGGLWWYFKEELEPVLEKCESGDIQ